MGDYSPRAAGLRGSEGTMSRCRVPAIVGVLTLAACGSAGGSGSEASDQTPIEAARARCGATGVGDNGRSIVLDTQGDEESTGDTIDVVGCVLGNLGISDSLVARIQATRALDGAQSGEWDGFTATWSYHPDSGMTIIVEQT